MTERFIVHSYPLGQRQHRHRTGGRAETAFVAGSCGVVAGLVPPAFWLAITFGAVGVGLGLAVRRTGLGQAALILGCVAAILGSIGGMLA